MTPRLLLALAAIVLLGLFLRMSALFTSAVSEPIRGDAVAYFFYAVNLQGEGVYSRATPPVFGGAPPRPDANIPPGYPAFIALFLGEQWRFGTKAGALLSIEPVLIAQTLLSSLTVLLVFLLGRRFLATAPALAVAVLTAIWPHLVNVNVYLLTESLFTLLFWLALWLLIDGVTRQGPPRGRLLLAGAAMAAAALTRPTVQYLPFLLALFFLMRAPGSWRRWGGFLAVFVLLVGAWGVRNQISVGSFSDPLAMKATIQHGSYPGFMFNGLPESRGIPYRYDPDMSLATPLAETLHIILQRARAAPGEYLWWYTLGKPLALFHWDTLPPGTADLRLTTAGDIFIYPTPVTP